jgi:hypothetical protein
MGESYFGVGGIRKGIRGREYLARVPVFWYIFGILEKRDKVR